MTTSEQLMSMIQDLDTLVVQLRLDGQEQFEKALKRVVDDLYWLYHDMTKIEVTT